MRKPIQVGMMVEILPAFWKDSNDEMDQFGHCRAFVMEIVDNDHVVVRIDNKEQTEVHMHVRRIRTSNVE
jgi:hypothetical protein